MGGRFSIFHMRSLLGWNSRAMAPMILALACVFSLAATGEAMSQDAWHVSPLGDNVSGDGSIAMPWATIQHAIDNVAFGDTIVLADTTFVGPENRDLVITDKSLVIKSSGGDPEACNIDCEFDNSSLGRGFTYEGSGTFRVDLMGVTIANALDDAIFVDMSSNTFSFVDCILRDAGDAGIQAVLGQFDIQGGQILDNGVGLNMGMGADCAGQGIQFEGNGIGVSLSQGPSYSFVDCWFTQNGTGAYGVGGKSGSSGRESGRQIYGLFEDCHFIGNDFGVSIEFGGTFLGCEFTQNVIAAAQFSMGSSATIDCCDFHDNLGDAVPNYRGSSLSILNSRFTGNVGLGVQAVTSGDINISNTLVACNGGLGLDLETEFMGNISINGSTVADNGVGVSATADGTVVFENTIVAFNDGEGICAAAATYTNCDVFGNELDLCPDGWTPGPNDNIEADPLFCLRCNGLPGDYSLAENSPCAETMGHPQIGALGVDCGPIIIGTIIVDVEPELTSLPWVLEGPDDLIVSGDNDTTMVAMPGGTYTIRWLPGDGWAPPVPEVIVADLGDGDTLTFAGSYGPEPYITDISDVGNDQGRQVRLIWNRCAYDEAGSDYPILSYGIYRQQADSLAIVSDPKTASRLAGWDFITEVPARGDPVYQTVVPTLCDSTGAGGVCWSVFMVSAQTQDPVVYFDSAPASGYSVDNLAPEIPSSIFVTYVPGGVFLDWDDAPEPDFNHHRIYADSHPEFQPAPENLIHETTDSHWTNDFSRDWGLHYKITTLDIAGNESEPGIPGDVSGMVGEGVPARTSLLGAVPNPFNPATKLSFEMATAGHARLKVYDAAGRLVATLMDEHRDPGKHEVIWDGRDNAGRMSAAGVYLYRLEAGSFSETKRMMLVK